VSEQEGKKISRRAFIGLGVAAAAALALGGREAFQALSHRGTTGTTGTTQGGVFNIKDFTIQRVTDDPKYQPDQWRLSVTGMVNQELSLSLDKFLALPQTQEVREFQCVEGWKVRSCPWEGVTVREIMSRADIKPQAKYIIFWSDDGVYSDTLTVEQALKPEVMLVHKLDGQELTPEQGWPVRLVMPGNYGYKYVKWVGRVVVTDQPHVGYWEKYGYSEDATIPG
jgi:sulfoxide reductase catalytic subunit YedY